MRKNCNSKTEEVRQSSKLVTDSSHVTAEDTIATTTSDDDDDDDTSEQDRPSVVMKEQQQQKATNAVITNEQIRREGSRTEQHLSSSSSSSAEQRHAPLLQQEDKTQRQRQRTSPTGLRDVMRTLLTGGDWTDEVVTKPPKSTLEIPNYNKEMLRTERHFRFVAVGAVVWYLSFVSIAYSIVHNNNNGRREREEDDNDDNHNNDDMEELELEQNEQLSNIERGAATISFVCLLVTLLLQLLPLFIKKEAHHPPLSGVVFAAIVVQGIAMMTNALMAFGGSGSVSSSSSSTASTWSTITTFVTTITTKIPILIDPVTGARVHLLRWSEWAPLAFTMTFLVEGSDIPDQRWGLLLVYANALCQGLSTACGFFFPLCPGIKSWSVVMVFSFLLFGFFFLRLRYKEARFKHVRKGKRLDELELYNRSSISLKLFRTCAVGWSYIVTMYCIFSFACPVFAPQGSVLRHPAVPMVTEAFTDVVLKVFYMSLIVSLHEQVFDEGARAKRRLEELRQMMWANSSDVLAISVQSLSGVVTTMVSPTFFKMLREGKASAKESLSKDELASGDRGMIFELPMKDLMNLLYEPSRFSRELVKPKLYDFDFGGLNVYNVKQKVHFSSDVTELVGVEEMQALAELMARSWLCEKRDSLLSHDLVLRNEKLDLETIQCEAKVTRLEESALFVVVRDISERFRRFEAEKVAVSEMTARQKDSEANRFTRHEMKNGLLAVLGLCESLQETVKEASGTLDKFPSALGDDVAEEMSKLATVQDNVANIVTEMDSALHEVLDTILTEAMARDVIHDAYVPDLAKVDMVPLLTTRHTHREIERFPVTSSPDPLPTFLFDSHLLKCIHRNAVSNAVKYGKLGGAVRTHLSYDADSKMFEMEVINEPGDNHSEIMKLGSEGAASVFEPGHRLHSTIGKGDKASIIGRRSSGDGAWIMGKCAKTLDGDCSIRFEVDRTIFSFQCPVAVFDDTQEHDEQHAANFKLPVGMWGIALDDSKMQRKLLKRFLSFAGISDDRIIVKGETAEEINGFDDFAYDFIGCRPNDTFLLIIDENLDLEFEDVHVKHSTISGSLLVQRLRYRLLPEQERQTVALIRSANDSSHDVAIYKSRAHGFIPKAPIKRDEIPALLSNIWDERFGSQYAESSIDSVHNQSTSSSKYSEGDTGESFIMEHIRKVDALVDQECDLTEHWSEIWLKLHALKGDLLSWSESEEVAVVVKKINDMRGRNLPLNFLARWHAVRELAVKLDAGEQS